jgi:hypothetical protein
MRRHSLALISVACSVLVVLWLNRSLLSGSGAALSWFVLAGLVFHGVWLVPYLAVALSCGTRYRASSLSRRALVAGVAGVVLFVVGSYWSVLLWSVGSTLEVLAPLPGAIGRFGRVVAHLEHVHPYSSLLAVALLSLVLFLPQAAWGAQSPRGASA